MPTWPLTQAISRTSVDLKRLVIEVGLQEDFAGLEFAAGRLAEDRG